MRCFSGRRMVIASAEDPVCARQARLTSFEFIYRFRKSCQVVASVPIEIARESRVIHTRNSTRWVSFLESRQPGIWSSFDFYVNQFLRIAHGAIGKEWCAWARTYRARSRWFNGVSRRFECINSPCNPARQYFDGFSLLIAWSYQHAWTQGGDANVISCVPNRRELNSYLKLVEDFIEYSTEKHIASAKICVSDIYFARCSYRTGCEAAKTDGINIFISLCFQWR